MTVEADIEAICRQLQDKHSAKRRSAALKLRKLESREAGPALLKALEKELEDKRTWETQYQMLMALGHSGYAEAAPFVELLAHRKFEATMVLVAVGDAYVRLSKASLEDARPVLKILSIENDRLLQDGALRAVAMLHMRFNEAETNAIIHHIEEQGDVEEQGREARKFWLIAACPGWSGHAVERFIEKCSTSAREDVRNTAADAKAKKYRKWRPL
jgi:hypothetical protein